MSKLFAVLVLFAVAGAVVAEDVATEVDVAAVAEVHTANADAQAIAAVDEAVAEAEDAEEEEDAAEEAAFIEEATEEDAAEEVDDEADTEDDAEEAVAGEAEAEAEAEADAEADNASCLAHYNGAAVATKAKAYQSNYKSRGVVYNQAKRQFGITAKFSDCSSFVTSVLNDMGYDCLFASSRNTAHMNAQIRTRGSYKQTAALGDIVMWGGHTGLIVEVCSAPKGTYKMVAMGLHGAGLTGCLTPKGLSSWGSGGWLGFWTPH